MFDKQVAPATGTSTPAKTPTRGRILADEGRRALSALEFAVRDALGTRPLSYLSRVDRLAIARNLQSPNRGLHLRGLGSLQRSLGALSVDFTYAEGAFPNAQIAGLRPWDYLVETMPHISKVFGIYSPNNRSAIRLGFNFAYGTPIHLARIARIDNPELSKEYPSLPKLCQFLTNHDGFSVSVIEPMAATGYGIYEDYISEVPDGKSIVAVKFEWYTRWRERLGLSQTQRIVHAWKDNDEWQFALDPVVSERLAAALRHPLPGYEDKHSSGCPLWRPASVSPLTPERRSGIAVNSDIIGAALNEGLTPTVAQEL